MQNTKLYFISNEILPKKEHIQNKFVSWSEIRSDLSFIECKLLNLLYPTELRGTRGYTTLEYMPAQCIDICKNISDHISKHKMEIYVNDSVHE
jgi:hypothetical protein